MPIYWLVEGRCIHPLCLTAKKIDRPWVGRVSQLCTTVARARNFLKSSEPRERRCPECHRPIARKHFKIVETEYHLVGED